MIFISRFMAGAVTLPECLTPNKCVRICGFVCVMVVGGGAFVVVAMAIPGFVRVAPVILVIVEVVASALLLVRIVAGFVRVVAVVGVTTVAVVGAIPSVMRVVPIFVHVIIIVDWSRLFVRIVASFMRSCALMAVILMAVVEAILGFMRAGRVILVLVLVRTIVVVDRNLLLVRSLAGVMRSFALMAVIMMAVVEAILGFMRAGGVILVRVLVLVRTVVVVDRDLMLGRVVASVMRVFALMAVIMMAVIGAIPGFMRVARVILVFVRVMIIVNQDLVLVLAIPSFMHVFAVMAVTILRSRRVDAVIVVFFLSVVVVDRALMLVRAIPISVRLVALVAPVAMVGVIPPAMCVGPVILVFVRVMVIVDQDLVPVPGFMRIARTARCGMRLSRHGAAMSGHMRTVRTDLSRIDPAIAAVVQKIPVVVPIAAVSRSCHRHDHAPEWPHVPAVTTP